MPAPGPEFDRMEPMSSRRDCARARAGRDARRGPRPRDSDGQPEVRTRDVDAPDPRARNPGDPDMRPRRRRAKAMRPEARGIDAVQTEDFTGDDFSPYMERIRANEAMEPDEERPSQRAYRRSDGRG